MIEIIVEKDIEKHSYKITYDEDGKLITEYLDFTEDVERHLNKIKCRLRDIKLNQLLDE
jgi:hypothetical protein